MDNDDTIAELQDTIVSQHGETIDRLDSLADQLLQSGLGQGASKGNGLKIASAL